jgi:hypothetical protein
LGFFSNQLTESGSNYFEVSDDTLPVDAVLQERFSPGVIQGKPGAAGNNY